MVLSATQFAPEYRTMAELLAAKNKSKQTSLSRVVRQLYEPLFEIERVVLAKAMQYGLRAATAAGAPNATYVGKAARSFAAGGSRSRASRSPSVGPSRATTPASHREAKMPEAICRECQSQFPYELPPDAPAFVKAAMNFRPDICDDCVARQREREGRHSSRQTRRTRATSRSVTNQRASRDSARDRPSGEGSGCLSRPCH